MLKWFKNTFGKCEKCKHSLISKEHIKCTIKVPEETQEQKSFRMHHEAITNLTNLRNLWLWLLSQQNTREKKKIFKRDFLASDKFSEELLEDTIKFMKKQSKSQ